MEIHYLIENIEPEVPIIRIYTKSRKHQLLVDTVYNFDIIGPIFRTDEKIDFLCVVCRSGICEGDNGVRCL